MLALGEEDARMTDPINREGMNAQDEAEWFSFLAKPGNEFAFRIGRTAGAIQREGSGVTFSREAMDAMFKHVMIYVGSRLTRYHNEHGSFPQAMTVRVRVALDDTAEDFEEEKPDEWPGPVRTTLVHQKEEEGNGSTEGGGPLA